MTTIEPSKSTATVVWQKDGITTAYSAQAPITAGAISHKKASVNSTSRHGLAKPSTFVSVFVPVLKDRLQTTMNPFGRVVTATQLTT